MALPDARRSASEEVADAIRAWMFGRDMAPGDRLGREEDLARRFGVSRPTLREALRLLSSAHLIRATKGPGGGIFVAATPEQADPEAERQLRELSQPLGGLLSATGQRSVDVVDAGNRLVQLTITPPAITERIRQSVEQSGMDHRGSLGGDILTEQSSSA